MNYFYAMTGGIKVVGCGKVDKIVYMTFRYSPGSTLFLCYKAARGVLEPVTIKKIILNSNFIRRISPTPLYQDTLNSFYNEWDLCSQSQAVAAATAYYNKQLKYADDLLKDCSIF